MIIDLLNGKDNCKFYSYQMSSKTAYFTKIATFTNYHLADEYLMFLKNKDYRLQETSNIIAVDRNYKNEDLENIVFDNRITY